MNCSMIASKMRAHGARGGKRFIPLLAVVASVCISTVVAEEQLEQETIVIKGNQGLPRTLYIAPWKRVGEPLTNSALETELEQETQPLERDLFQRELELRREGYSVEQPSVPDTGSGIHDSAGTTR